MSEKRRATNAIRCVDCGETNAYERCGEDHVWDIKCPDCGVVFGWGNLPKECLSCKGKLRAYDSAEMGRGRCWRCHYATYSPEKMAALNKMIGLVFRDPPAPDAEKDAAIDEASEHMD